MEDYLMRSSPTTNRLRRTFASFDATESEFRSIYTAQAAYDQKYSYENTGGGIVTAEMMKERSEAQKETSAQIKAALGDQRYAEYVRSSDREFQQISRLTQQANLPDSTALQVYNLRENTTKESGRIYADAALSNDQKRAALQVLAQNTRAQISATLGAEAGQAYLQVADRWLSRIERGNAVTFSETGAMNARTVPTARPPTAPAPAATTTPGK